MILIKLKKKKLEKEELQEESPNFRLLLPKKANRIDIRIK